ncbi:MAG TPA: cupin domain-containing protein [Capsulimonadaceae bacterium]
MVQAKLSEIEEYSTEKFVIKPIYEGVGGLAKVMHLLSGQGVPVHPHPGKEVTLFPQKGSATVTWEDGTEQLLEAGSVYYQGVAPTFGVTNTGSEPFQMVVLVVHTPGK